MTEVEWNEIRRRPVRIQFPDCYREGMYRPEPECWTCDIHSMCKPRAKKKTVRDNV